MQTRRLADADAPLPSGAFCGEYVVERLLGRGGFARVYAARHRVLGRRMAIKVLDRQLARSPRAFLRFMWEARTACRVRHPGIVEVVDFGRLPDQRPFLVMEHLDGESLEDRLATCGRLDVGAAVRIVDALADALSVVHAAGIVHRDLKPANVFLCRGDARTVLLDFGIAKLVRPEPDDRPIATTAGTRLGTTLAMAPEAIRGGPVDERADVYGLGVTLYRMIAGAWPFTGDDAEVEHQHLTATPAPPSLAGCDRRLDAVIARALAKDPDERFANALSLAAALRQAAHEPPASTGAALRVAGDAVACRLVIRPRDLTGDHRERIAAILDLAGDRIVRRGWRLTAQAPDALLTAAPSPPAALADAGALADELLAHTRRLRGGVLDVVTEVHADRAVLDGARTRVLGGRITASRLWPRRDRA